jgi:hypothetical protein
MSQDERSFHTVYGRHLVAEIKHFVHLSSFVVEAGLPYGITDEAELTDRWVAGVQERVEQAFPAVPT